MFLSQSKDQVAFISHVSLPTVTVYSLTLIISTLTCIFIFLSLKEKNMKRKKSGKPEFNSYLF